MSFIFYVAVALTFFLFLALLSAPVLLRPSPAARRMLAMVKSTRPDERTVGTKELIQNARSVVGPGSAALATWSACRNDDPEANSNCLQRAGLQLHPSRHEYFIAAQPVCQTCSFGAGAVAASSRSQYGVLVLGLWAALFWDS